jgi:hypothetical protein
LVNVILYNVGILLFIFTNSKTSYNFSEIPVYPQAKGMELASERQGTGTLKAGNGLKQAFNY